MPGGNSNDDGVNVREVVGRENHGTGLRDLFSVVKAKLHHETHQRQRNHCEKPEQRWPATFTHEELLAFNREVGTELTELRDEVSVATTDDAHVGYT